MSKLYMGSDLIAQDGIGISGGGSSISSLKISPTEDTIVYYEDGCAYFDALTAVTGDQEIPASIKLPIKAGPGIVIDADEDSKAIIVKYSKTYVEKSFSTLEELISFMDTGVVTKSNFVRFAIYSGSESVNIDHPISVDMFEYMNDGISARLDISCHCIPSSNETGQWYSSIRYDSMMNTVNQEESGYKIFNGNIETISNSTSIDLSSATIDVVYIGYYE